MSAYHVQYGFFCGGDPRHFTPDEESCSPDEIAAWNEACAMWERADSEHLTLQPEAGSGQTFYDDAGNMVMHVLAPKFGIGICRYPCVGDGCDLCECGDEAV